MHELDIARSFAFVRASSSSDDNVAGALGLVRNVSFSRCICSKANTSTKTVSLFTITFSS